MNIAVCDDDRFAAMKMCARIRILVPECEVGVFRNGNDLIEAEETWDIVFLDIAMNEISGFQIAEYLMEHRPDCVFSFVTSHQELAVDGYDYQPVRYILKDAPEAVINRKIKETVSAFYAKNRTVEISYRDIKHFVNPKDIQWIEADSHYSHVYTRDGEILWGKKMDVIERELHEDHIVRCHRSFAVHLKSISCFSGTKVILKNGKVISVGRTYEKKIKREYQKFITGE
ncbi:MAG: LytTR family DNA-binding domain-containing protein [Clostridia bacterium]|nr:LytTR family DNA-binding domain-containing protein [Clostridia bacterium]